MAESFLWMAQAEEGIMEKSLFGYRGVDLTRVQEHPLSHSSPLLASLVTGSYYRFHHFSHEIGTL